MTVQAVATPGDPGNLIALLTYPDGSVAKIAYVTTGDPKYPKEVLESTSTRASIGPETP